VAARLSEGLVRRRSDLVIAMTAMVGVLLSTVLTGMIVAVLLSVLLLLYRASRPYVAVLGRMPGPRGVLIDLAATADLDVTTTDMLFELVGDLRSRSIGVLVAQVRGTVRDRLRKTGLMDELGEDRVYLSIGSAVNDFGRRWPPAAADRVDIAARSVDRLPPTGHHRAAYPPIWSPGRESHAPVTDAAAGRA
jgi:MFS superfamily sulfate permease-like transporter